MTQARNIVSVLVECGGRRFRVVDNLRDLVGREDNRTVSETRIGRKVLDLARTLEVKQHECETCGGLIVYVDGEWQHVSTDKHLHPGVPPVPRKYLL